jgi:hypothetical protein
MSGERLLLSLTKPLDTVGKSQDFIFQWPNIFSGVDTDRLKAQIQAVATTLEEEWWRRFCGRDDTEMEW